MRNSRLCPRRLLTPDLALLCAALTPALGHAADIGADPTQLPEVQVVSAQESPPEGSVLSGYRAESATAGPLGRMPLQETPYSINVTSGELFENRAAHTVSEALKTNPTVATLMESSGYSSMSRVMVRGFTAADQSDLRDGLVDRSFAFVPLENVERIEVMNGLSGFMYGFSALGGSVNYVSKQPTAASSASLAGGIYGGGIGYVHGDAGGPLAADPRWGYRLNVYGEDGGNYIDDNEQRRDLVSAVIDFRPLPGTRIWADAWRQELTMNGLQTYINVNPAAGIFVPDAGRFDAATQYGQDWTYNKSRKTLIGLGLESELTRNIRLRAAYRRGDMWRDYLFVGATLTDNLGNYTEKATGSTRQTELTHSAQALLDIDFDTGGIRHQLSFGYTGTDFDYTRGEDVSTVLGSSSVASPLTYANPGLVIGPTTTWSATRYDNWVLGDRIRFSPVWSALLGLNRAAIVQDRWGSATALSNQHFDQRKTTPSAALMFQPAPAVTTYLSYMEGLQNGGTAPSTAANANELLPPSASKQYELGVKAGLGGVALTAALFRMDVINQYTDPSDNVYKQDGREIHEGMELTATGKLTAGLTLVGGFTVMNAEVERAKNNPAIEGKTPVNVPERLARLYLEYELPGIAGLTLVGGANHSGRRPVDAANTDYLAAATTYDLGARYHTRTGGHPLTLNLTVSNLFDQAYWTYYRSGDGLLLGSPRVVAVTAKLDW